MEKKGGDGKKRKHKKRKWRKNIKNKEEEEGKGRKENEKSAVPVFLFHQHLDHFQLRIAGFDQYNYNRTSEQH